MPITCTGPRSFRTNRWKRCSHTPSVLGSMFSRIRLLKSQVSMPSPILPPYWLTHSGRASPTQIGLGRVITDETTFAYLTDVFILPEYQGKGLGRWLMNCINETFNSWPDFRAAMLYTGGHDGERAQKFYEQIFGMRVFKPGEHGLQIMVSNGPGSFLKYVWFGVHLCSFTWRKKREVIIYINK